MRYEYHTLDVFADRIFGGNPLAVFPDARGLTGGQMQAIARELNLSETVFVLPPESPEGTRRVRIFTPGVELPFAGHPTIGTAILLAELGAVPFADGRARVVLEEGVGPVPVLVRRLDEGPLFAQLTSTRAPEFGPAPPSRAETAALLGIDPEDLAEAPWSPVTVSSGVPFLIVPVRTLDALARVRLDPGQWEALLKAAWAPHVYVITPETGSPAVDIRARMFAPAMGIAEDPATGAAAAALAAYLADRCGAADGVTRWVVEQGIEMGRPGRLQIEAELAGGQIRATRVGGSAVRVGSGVMDLPDTGAAAPRRDWEPVAVPDVPPPAGAYSRAVRAGEFIYVSGQVPRDLRTGELTGDDVETQTRAVLENVRLVLGAAGASLDDVVSITAYLADIGDWETFNRVYRELFRPPYPTRTTLGAQLHGVLVEISAIARVGR